MPRADRRKLGRKHAAERVTDHIHHLQPERLDELPEVQAHIEHVVDLLDARRLAEAGMLRRVDAAALGETRQEGGVNREAIDAVQIQQRLAVALAPTRTRNSPFATGMVVTSDISDPSEPRLSDDSILQWQVLLRITRRDAFSLQFSYNATLRLVYTNQ